MRLCLNSSGIVVKCTFWLFHLCNGEPHKVFGQVFHYIKDFYFGASLAIIFYEWKCLIFLCITHYFKLRFITGFCTFSCLHWPNLLCCLCPPLSPLLNLSLPFVSPHLHFCGFSACLFSWPIFALFFFPLVFTCPVSVSILLSCILISSHRPPPCSEKVPI